jgi:hypothetical protein
MSSESVHMTGEQDEAITITAIPNPEITVPSGESLNVGLHVTEKDASGLKMIPAEATYIPPPMVPRRAIIHCNQLMIKNPQAAGFVRICWPSQYRSVMSVGIVDLSAQLKHKTH